MKRFFTLLAIAAFAISAFAGTEFTFTSADDVIQEKDNITIMLDKANGSNDPYYYLYATGGPEMRLYPQNTITVSGEGLTNIQIVFTKPSDKTYITTMTPSAGNLVSGGASTGPDGFVVDRWTGSATEVVFTMGDNGQRVIRKIVVNGDSINPDEEQPAQPTPLPTEQDLDPEYVYSEPAIITVPDTFINAREYAFIDDNILVHCSEGAINQAGGNITTANFSCYAGKSITFTATQAIKGISIDGWIKKNFSATVNRGLIDDLSSDETDIEAFPVLVITDIDSTSVTLSCDKQLRCYSVEVYFEENPEGIEKAVADTTDLSPVSAVAVDYSETEYSSEGSYSYWIKLSSADTYPQIWLDIYSAVKGDLSGEYSPYAYNVGEQTYVWFSDGDTDGVTAYDIDVTIEKIESGYSISGILTCWGQGQEWEEDSEDLVYRFSYEGPVTFVAPDDEQGLDEVQNDKGQSTKVLRNGQLIILRGERQYNVLGTQL